MEIIDSKIIVSAHYEENLDWIQNIKLPVIAYSKTDSKYRKICKNKGQEVPAFLKYIIDEYPNFHSRILFVHGHLDSPHQDYPIDYIINNLNWKLSNFFSINKRSWYQEVSEDNHIEKDGYEWLKNNWCIFQNRLSLPKSLKFYSGAQFVVSSKCILSHPLSFYKNLFVWVQSTSIETYIVSRIFEYTWHYIFTNNPTEKVLHSILI